MKIGIISDTHDNVQNVIEAVKVFKARKVAFVVHCGDVVAPKTVLFFKGLRLKLVAGNCDGDLEHVQEKLSSIQGEFLGSYGELLLGGKKILVYHGHDSAILDSFIKPGKYHYVVTGHTHVLKDERIGATRVLNPGAHYYGCEGTIMVLDVATDKVEVVKI